MNGTGSALDIYPLVPTSCYVEHLHLTVEKENNHHSKLWVKLVLIRCLNCNETERKQKGITAYKSSPPSLPHCPFHYLQPGWSIISLQFPHRPSSSPQAGLMPKSVSSLIGWGKISASESYDCGRLTDTLGQFLLYPRLVLLTYFYHKPNKLFATE